jgi:endonuclease III
MNPDLQTALDDLAEAIQSITLGSVESVVIQEAGQTLIQNWNDHHDIKIDEVLALQLWQSRQSRPQLV